MKAVAGRARSTTGLDPGSGGFTVGTQQCGHSRPGSRFMKHSPRTSELKGLTRFYFLSSRAIFRHYGRWVRLGGPCLLVDSLALTLWLRYPSRQFLAGAGSAQPPTFSTLDNSFMLPLTVGLEYRKGWSIESVPASYSLGIPRFLETTDGTGLTWSRRHASTTKAPV